MRVGLSVALAVTLLALAGCQSTGGGGSGAAAPAPAPAAAEPAAPAPTGDKVSICTSQAAAKYGVSGDALSLSNEYPTADGDAIDGAATLAQGFKRFRCDFTRAGAYISITELAQDGA